MYVKKSSKTRTLTNCCKSTKNTKNAYAQKIRKYLPYRENSQKKMYCKKKN